VDTLSIELRALGRECDLVFSCREVISNGRGDPRPAPPQLI